MSQATVVDRVIEHWFGPLNTSRYDTFESKHKIWYTGSQEIDDDLRQRFGSDVEVALDGGLDHLIRGNEYPVKGELALVLLLDQLPRNIYRGTAKAFAGDTKCREIVASILEPARWSMAKKVLPPAAQVSFLLALMHQESVTDLDLCKSKLEDLINDCRDAGEEAKPCVAMLQGMIGYADRHRDILVQYGRYPYRNAVLGRESTEAELEFLKDGPRFGQ